MAKVVKLKDRNSNSILPLTRSTLVEMNDGVSVQTAYEGINATHYTKDEIDSFGYVTYSYLDTKLNEVDKISELTDYDRSYAIEVGDTHDEAFSKLIKIIDENEYVTARALTELHDDMKSYVSTNDLNNASYVTRNEIISAGYLTSHQSLESYVTSANYDSNAKKIYLKHNNTVLSEIDATDFIKDGMVDTAYVQGNNLVISFNTDAGKEDINIPISDIFNPNNYYTKSDIDSASYVSQTQLSANSYVTQTALSANSYVTQTALSANGYLTSYTETDPTVPSYVKNITQSDITSWGNKSKNIVANFVFNGTRVTSCDKKFAVMYDAIINGDIVIGNVNNGYGIGHVIQYTNSVILFNIIDNNGTGVKSYELAVHSDDTYSINVVTIDSDNFVTSGEYISGDHIIYLYNSEGNSIIEIDATDFIKDGMVDTAYVDGSYLVISFNTDSGKEPVNVPISNIFNANNYYTKSDIDNAGYLTSFTETDPIFSASPAAGITSGDIEYWNHNTPLIVNITANVGNNTVISDVPFADAWDAYNNDKRTIFINYNIIYNSNNKLICSGTVQSAHLYNTVTDAVFGSNTSEQRLTGVLYTGYRLSNNIRCIQFSWTSANIVAHELWMYSGEGSLTLDPPYDLGSSERITFNYNGTIDFSQYCDRTQNNTIIIRSDLNSYVSKSELNSASYISSSSLDTTLNTTLSSYATSANYDSNAKKIYLKHGSTTLSEIDATDFIKDGMVDTAYVSGSYLVISFNTDSGKEPVNVPISNIFNANNYYTKSDIDNAGYLTSFTETDPTVPSYVKDITEQNITDWNNKLSVETQLSKGTTIGSGNAVTDISVSNHQITLTKDTTFLTEHQSLKTINGNTITGTGDLTIGGLPTVTSSDNGKVLRVVNGQWELVTPVTTYSGTATPDNSQGNNGDLYMQI